MAGKVKVPVGPNQFADGTRVGFKPISEPWCELDCDDGTRIRVKLVVTEVIKIDGARTPEGDPVYVIRSSNVMHATVPEGEKDGQQQSGETKKKTPGTYL